MEELEARMKALEQQAIALERRVSCLEQGYVYACSQFKTPIPERHPFVEMQIHAVDGESTSGDTIPKGCTPFYFDGDIKDGDIDITE